MENDSGHGDEQQHILEYDEDRSEWMRWDPEFQRFVGLGKSLDEDPEPEQKPGDCGACQILKVVEDENGGHLLVPLHFTIEGEMKNKRLKTGHSFENTSMSGGDEVEQSGSVGTDESASTLGQEAVVSASTVPSPALSPSAGSDSPRDSLIASHSNATDQSPRNDDATPDLQYTFDQEDAFTSDQEDLSARSSSDDQNLPEDSKTPAMQNWRIVIPDLLQGLHMSQGVPQKSECLVCDQTIKVWTTNDDEELLLRCFDCGRGVYFCSDCGLSDHFKRNRTHKVEAWLPSPVVSEVEEETTFVEGVSHRSWQQIDVKGEDGRRIYRGTSSSPRPPSEQPSSSPLEHSFLHGPLFGCGCERSHQHRFCVHVYEPYGLSKRFIQVHYDSCHEHRARTLVTLGYWPMTPLRPQLALSLKSMELLHRQRSPFSSFLWCGSML